MSEHDFKPRAGPGRRRADRVVDGLFRGSPIPILMVDAASREVLEANRAVGRLLDAPARELVGRDLGSLDAAGPEDVSEYLLLALAAGDDRPRRRTLQRPDGSAVPVEIRAVPLGDDEGPVLALYVRDARPDQTREEDRDRLQAQLWLSQKHEAVGRLSAGIAHDFSNLLSVVMLTAETLRERFEEDAEVVQDLDAIIDAGFRARELTVELLTFSGKRAMEPRPISLNEVVVGMEGLLRRTLSESIELVLRPCEGQAAVNADPSRMQQVLLNLVVNARDAMPSGGHLVIATKELEVEEDFAREHPPLQAGPHVLLSVSDTGVGMDEETQARIFDPFFTTRERGFGAGLGLSTVRGIVMQSGGVVLVTSQPGAGTTFRIFLPRLAGAPRRRVGPRGVRVGGLPGGTEHVLVVEDDDRVRRQVTRILQELGYQVSEAADPAEAIRLHDELWPRRGEHPVHLVLTDVIMPGMSGPEMVRKLRQKREDLRVAYMSGYLDPMAEEDTTSPVGAYLAKPFSREDLARCVRRALDADAPST